MNKNHAHRALPRGLFVFVSPAAVVGQGLTFEKSRVIRRRLVHQHQKDFAAHIHTLVVVPVVFGSFDAVTHVHDLGVHIGLRLLRLIEGNILIESLQVHS